MKLKKFVPLLLIFGLFLAACEKDDFRKGPPGQLKITGKVVWPEPSGDEPNTVPLYAGQTNLVGEVTVDTDDYDNFIVTYKTDPGWFITETHLHIWKDGDDFPFAGKSKNPAIGLFAYGNDHHYKEGNTYKIPRDEIGIVDHYYIAAHAVVEGLNDLENLEYLLPETCSVKVTKGGPNHYFPIVEITDDGVFDGTYNGWCAQSEFQISEGVVYGAVLEIPTHPNINKVNWILNQGFVGQEVNGAVITYLHVQWAMWDLISTLTRSLYNEADLAIVDYIIELAEDYEEAYGPFEPGCGDVFALILRIDGKQDVIIEFPFNCGDETAWGDGRDGIRFTNPGNWATYFIFNWPL